MTMPLPAEAAPTVARHWQQGPLVDRDMLEQLFEINRIYLDFLASRLPVRLTGERLESGIRLQRPPSVAPQHRCGQLANLPPAARRLLARCPFSLFTARFNDGAFWGGLAQANGVHEVAPPYASHKLALDGAAVADLALFYAWHLVRASRLVARILLGMNEQTLSAFQRLPLTRLQQLALEQPTILTLRWQDRGPFWRSVLSLASLGNEERLGDLRLLGIQMIASELIESRSPA